MSLPTHEEWLASPEGQKATTDKLVKQRLEQIIRALFERKICSRILYINNEQGLLFRIEDRLFKLEEVEESQEKEYRV